MNLTVSIGCFCIVLCRHAYVVFLRLYIVIVVVLYDKQNKASFLLFFKIQYVSGNFNLGKYTVNICILSALAIMLLLNQENKCVATANSIAFV